MATEGVCHRIEEIPIPSWCHCTECVENRHTVLEKNQHISLEEIVGMLGAGGGAGAVITTPDWARFVNSMSA